MLLPLQRCEVVRSELADGAGTNQEESAPPIAPEEEERSAGVVHASKPS